MLDDLPNAGYPTVCMPMKNVMMLCPLTSSWKFAQQVGLSQEAPTTIEEELIEYNDRATCKMVILSTEYNQKCNFSNLFSRR